MFDPGDIARHESYGTVVVQCGPHIEVSRSTYLIRTSNGTLRLEDSESLTPETEEVPLGTMARNADGITMSVISGPFGVRTNRPWYVVRDHYGIDRVEYRDRLTVVSLPESAPYDITVGDRVRTEGTE